ncbi:MAG: TetR/AcrR family transcriptional regulator [Solirubrobacterales bacterium]
MKRKYELKKRAEDQAETRRRITEVTVGLHEEVGPARTTVAEIARRAGVQRLTVYNNFPAERDLLAACQQHFFAIHPRPDLAPLSEVPDPARRLRLALRALYPWYRETERMSTNVFRDAAVMPALQELLADTQDAADAELRSVLARGFGARGAARGRLEAAIRLATNFWTWRSLAHEGGLPDGEAAEVAARAVEAAVSAQRVTT